MQVMEQYLANNGIFSYSIKYVDRKHYMCFDVPHKGESKGVKFMNQEGEPENIVHLL